MATIGIFDCGVGGLSVFREIRRLIPGASYVYYADSAFCPYGEKTPGEIQDRARAITDILLSKGADVVVVACNTATAAAISTLRSEYGIPFVGMEPAVKPAALGTRSGVIGVLATAGTLKGSLYIHTKGHYESDVRIIEHVGSGFVELVEKGILDGPQAEATVERSLEPLVSAGADTIVLGCTHYPFLLPVMERVAARIAPASDIRFIDPAPAVARQTLKVLEGVGQSCDGEFSMELLSSANCEVLQGLYDKLL